MDITYKIEFKFAYSAYEFETMRIDTLGFRFKYNVSNKQRLNNF